MLLYSVYSFVLTVLHQKCYNRNTLLNYSFVVLSAKTDPDFSLPHERFRFGIIPAGSTDALVIWYYSTRLFNFLTHTLVSPFKTNLGCSLYLNLYKVFELLLSFAKLLALWFGYLVLLFLRFDVVVHFLVLMPVSILECLFYVQFSLRMCSHK